MEALTISGGYVDPAIDFVVVKPGQSQLTMLDDETRDPYVQVVATKDINSAVVCSDGSLRW